MTPGATTVDVAGRPVVLSYTNVGAEYDALRRRAIVVDRSHRGRIRFTGAKAADVLDGLLTNDVGALHAGQGQYAFALSPKGKVIADMRVLRDGVDFVTDASPRSRDGWAATVKKYVNPRLSKYADESESTRALGVYGVQARHVVEHMTGISAAALGIMPSFTHASASREGARVLVMRSPDLGIEGFDLIVAADGFDSLWSAATHARATPAGQSAWDIARVESGRPEWGVDMDDSTIPQEANVDALDAVSYTKGCYTGQEVVARVHFRGHVNRTLRGLTFAGALPAGRASLFDASDKAVGEVTSAVASPRLGAIALAMVRRDVADGATLAARWPADPAGDAAAGEAQATVVALPFAS